MDFCLVLVQKDDFPKSSHTALCMYVYAHHVQPPTIQGRLLCQHQLVC